MKTAHTPGPWIAVTQTRVDGAQDILIKAGENIVAKTYCRPKAIDQTQADMALIAAAPELLVLLKKAQRLGLDLSIGSAYISRAYITEQDALNAHIDALISKATGAKS